MRIAIPTDAWHPQVSGVVTKFERIAWESSSMGHEVCLITPDMFRTVPCPTYPQIRLALKSRQKSGRAFGCFLLPIVYTLRPKVPSGLPPVRTV